MKTKKILSLIIAASLLGGVATYAYAENTTDRTNNNNITRSMRIRRNSSQNCNFNDNCNFSGNGKRNANGNCNFSGNGNRNANGNCNFSGNGNRNANGNCNFSGSRNFNFDKSFGLINNVDTKITDEIKDLAEKNNNLRNDNISTLNKINQFISDNEDTKLSDDTTEKLNTIKQEMQNIRNTYRQKMSAFRSKCTLTDEEKTSLRENIKNGEITNEQKTILEERAKQRIEVLKELNKELTERNTSLNDILSKLQ